MTIRPLFLARPSLSNACRTLLAYLLLAWCGHAGTVLANGFIPVQTFYVPLPEDHLLQSFTTIAGGRTGQYAPQNPIQSYLSIAVFADNTEIRYDQWENGFDINIANPAAVYGPGQAAGTQIWGDGDPSNGYAPGYPADILNAGDVVILTNAVVSTARGTTAVFDGGDKIVSSKPIAVTRVAWASGSNSNLAGANEVFDTAFWGTFFICPVGTNIADSVDFQMFEYTGLSIMAGAGGATVQIDANADGLFETSTTLTEGQAYLVDGGVHLGAQVSSDRPVQVDLLTADIYDYYESRFMRLLPTAYWAASLTTPVSTPATVTKGSTTYTCGTTVWLYNPGQTPLGVQYLTRTGGSITTNTLTIPGGSAGGSLKQVLPSDFGARFVSTNGAPFYAVAAVDGTGTDLSTGLNDQGDNRNWDWGFALVPDASLTPQVLVGLGIGHDPTAGEQSENSSPVWVTPVGNGNSPVTIYVDFDADPTTGTLTDEEGNLYDASYTARELDCVKIYNPDGDQSGLLAYVLEPGVKLAAAWGPDPVTASTGTPGIDLGTAIPPFPLFVAQKRTALLTDSDHDGFVSPGDTLLYSISIQNTGRQPVTGLDVKDNLPPGITYFPNTTYFVNAAAVTNLMADNTVPLMSSLFPLDEGGVALPEPFLPVRGEWEVLYTVGVDAYGTFPSDLVSLKNTAWVGGSGLTTTNTVVSPVYGRITCRIWQDLDEDGLQAEGEPGINGVKVTLLSADGEPILNDFGIPITSTSTTNEAGVAGYLTFYGVLAGEYRLEYLAPTGMQPTLADRDGQGVAGDANSDADMATGITAAFPLAAGQPLEHVDAGFVFKSGTASGFIRLDANGDGVAAPDETVGIAGVTVQLLNTGGVVVATALTSATGAYAFGNIRPGTYTLVPLLPQGYTASLDTAAPNDLRIPLTVTPELITTGHLFYFARTAGTVAQGKVLYLSDPGQTLDRIDPAAANDQTTATSATLIPAGIRASPITVVGAAASSSLTQTAQTHSFSYHSGTTGTNRILLVGVSYRNRSSQTVSSVTYGGTALTSVGTAQNGTGARVYIYRLLNPPTGANTLQVNWSSSIDRSAVVGAVTLSGVNQTTPTGTFASSTGSSGTPAVTVTAAAERLVFGIVSGRSTSAYSVTGGGTALWSAIPDSGDTAGSGQSKAGATSVSLSWSGSSAAWAAAGVSLIPASAYTPGNPTVSFTQAPAFALPFSLTSGSVITITNYVTLTSGTLPASPAVVARLLAGNETFLTLATPSYNGGALIWSGALASNVTIAAGQALSLSVSNGQAGAEFQLRYDSGAAPSKIILPTTSIISIPSLGVYDAPYPAGVPVTNTPAGALRYVRATVSDPFGAYDITGATLALVAAGTNASINVALTDARVVASNAWSKTYEYAWQPPLVSERYLVSLVAQEGTEGIHATAATQVDVAGLLLQGTLFIDKNKDGYFDLEDLIVTNATVYLLLEDQVVGEALADEQGQYSFTDVPTGKVKVVTSLLPGTKPTKVPSSPNNNKKKNRAVQLESDAIIEVEVTVEAYTEPLNETQALNFGFEEIPLSAALDLTVYASSSGILIDVNTVDESGYEDIVVYAWIGTRWVEVGRVPGEQLMGEGSNRYTIPAYGLMAETSYRFMVVDEQGNTHYSNGLIPVQSLRVKAVRLNMQTLTLSFNTEPGRRYRVKSSTDLVHWSSEGASYPTANGWSKISAAPFTASDTQIQVRVPANGRQRAFFRIERVDD